MYDAFSKKEETKIEKHSGTHTVQTTITHRIFIALAGPRITNKAHVKVELTPSLLCPFGDAATPCSNPGVAHAVVVFSQESKLDFYSINNHARSV